MGHRPAARSPAGVATGPGPGSGDSAGAAVVEAARRSQPADTRTRPNGVRVGDRAGGGHRIGCDATAATARLAGRSRRRPALRVTITLTGWTTAWHVNRIRQYCWPTT